MKIKAVNRILFIMLTLGTIFGIVLKVTVLHTMRFAKAFRKRVGNGSCAKLVIEELLVSPHDTSRRLCSCILGKVIYSMLFFGGFNARALPNLSHAITINGQGTNKRTLSEIPTLECRISERGSK